MLSACSGGIVANFLKPVIMGNSDFHNRFEVGTICNGILAGLVGVTGSCYNISPYDAFLIGIISAVCYCTWCRFLDYMKIDDPVEASAVHFACGLFGCVATGIFD